jgi:hypothetical protein
MTQHSRVTWSTLLLCSAAVALPLLLTLSCETGTSGAWRPIDPALENQITNVLTIATQAAVKHLPFPWSDFFGAAGGAALTVLAAWQALTHRKLSAIVAQVNGGQKKEP